MTCDRGALNEVQTSDAKLNAHDKLSSEALQKSISATVNKFDQIDKDKDGFLTPTELNQAPDKKFGATLAKNIDQIQSLSNDEWFFENDGITKNDLALLNQSARSFPEEMRIARDIRETIERNFRTISGGDTRIRRGELTSAANSTEYSQCDREAMAEGLERFGSIGHKSGKSSRKIKEWHLKEYEGEVSARFKLPISMANDLQK